MTKFIKYDKYIVIKKSDVNKYITKKGQEELSNILDHISAMRKQEGKENHNYIVVNQDMPYARQVWSLIAGEALDE